MIHSFSHHPLRLLVTLLSLCVITLSGCTGLRIPAPDVPVKSLSPVPVKDSTIVLPIVISLESVLGDLGASKLLEQKMRRFLERQTAKDENALLRNPYVRKQLGKAWDAVQKPIALQNDLSLLLNPQSLSVSPLREEEGRFGFLVAVVARPKLVSSFETSFPVQPLPELVTAPAASEQGFHIALETELSYDFLGKELKKQFEGKPFSGHGESVAIKDVKAYGSGESLVIAVKVNGSVNGTVYLSGTPIYDRALQRLYLRNLDYTLDTIQVLNKAADWLMHTNLQESLARKATWSLGDKIESARQSLTTALNRSLTEQVRLSGKIAVVRPIAVGLTNNGIRAVIEADGSVEMSVSN